MKTHKNKWKTIIGWILFLLAIGIFLIQMGYLYAHAAYNIVYVDHRLFYFFNMFWVICSVLSIFLLFTMTRKSQIMFASIGLLFIIGNAALLAADGKQIHSITSVSPDFKNILSMKADMETGHAVYYRVYYGILARPKEVLPYKTAGKFKVEWLASDIAAITYKTKDDAIQQFIGTYGDRGGGVSYYNVGPEIQGHWQADHVAVISDTDGIAVTADGKTELFEWEHIQQFGTLAIVLKREDTAAWTIALDENFEVHSDASKPMTGDIILYEASLEDHQPVTLQYKGL